MAGAAERAPKVEGAESRVVKEGGMEVAVCAAAVAKVDCSAA